MGFGKDGTGTIFREIQTITLSTLASGAALKAAATAGIVEDFRILKTEYVAFVDGAVTDGEPFLIGIADNGLTVTEIQECLNTGDPSNPSDFPEAENAMRPVWVTDGYIGHVGTAELTGRQKLQGEIKLRWTFNDAVSGWTWFAFNIGGATMTTGVVVRIYAKHFGVWVT